MDSEIDRCRRELARCRAHIAACGPDTYGALMGLGDWFCELKLLEVELSKLRISGTELRSAEMIKEEAVTFYRLPMASPPSPALLEALGCGEIPSYIASGKLIGELLVSAMTLSAPEAPQMPLIPNEAACSELSLTVDSVEDFKFSRAKDGDSTRLEIRFVVRTSQIGAGGLLEDWQRNGPKSTANLCLELKEKKKPGVDARQGSLLEHPDGRAKSNEEILGGHSKPAVAAFELKDDQGNVLRTFDSLEEMQNAAGEGAGTKVALPTAREGAGGTPHLRSKKPGQLAAKAGAVQ